MGSTRLPGKSMKEIAGKPLLSYVLKRVSKAQSLHDIILATSSRSENDPLCTLAKTQSVKIYRGSEEDVLSRFIDVAHAFEADIVVRVCADNPLVDPEEIDRIVKHHVTYNADYSFNNIPNETNGYPDGLGVEVINAKILFEIGKKDLSPEQKEHVTQYIIDNPTDFKIESPKAPENIKGTDIKLDIDTESDFTRMKQFIESLPSDNFPFWSSLEIVKAYRFFFQKKIVALVETSEDVEAVQKFETHIQNRITIVATTPHICWLLDSKKIAFKPLDLYFDKEFIYDEGIKNYQRLFQFCKSIDTQIAKENELVKNFTLGPASDNFPVIKIIYDQLLIKTIILYNILNNEKPDLIVSFGLNEEIFQVNNNIVPFEDDDNIFSLLLNLKGWPCKTLRLPRCKPKPISDKLDETKKNLKDKTLMKISFRHLFFISPRNGLIQSLSNLFYVIKNRIARGKIVLLVGFAYDWDSLIPILLRKGYRIFAVSSPLIDYTCSQEWDTRNLPDYLFSDLCCWNNMDFSTIFRKYISHSIQKSVWTAKLLCKDWDDIFKTFKPSVVLPGPRMTFSDNLPLKIARFYHIPVISWQHGSHGFIITPIIFFHELMNTDVHLSWGKGVTQWIETDPQNFFETPSVTVGSIELERLFFSNNDDGTLFNVLYATTAYYGNSLYVTIRYPLADTALWQTQQKIIHFLGKINKKTAVRLHPAPRNNQHICEMIASFNYNNLTLKVNHFSFVDLVKRSDVVILDWPSTTLLQAIALRKTVFVLLKHIQLTDDAIILLKKRVYCCEDIDEFTEMIRCYLNNETLDQKPDINNTEFLERFGITQLDGHVAERAIGVLENIIKRT